MQEKKKLFLKDKPVKILLAIHKTQLNQEKCCIRDTAIKADTTYSHATRTINKMIKHNLIKTQKQGRKKTLQTTETGEKITETLEQLLNTETKYKYHKDQKPNSLKQQSSS